MNRLDMTCYIRDDLEYDKNSVGDTEWQPRPNSVRVSAPVLRDEPHRIREVLTGFSSCVTLLHRQMRRLLLTVTWPATFFRLAASLAVLRIVKKKYESPSAENQDC